MADGSANEHMSSRLVIGISSYEIGLRESSGVARCVVVPTMDSGGIERRPHVLLRQEASSLGTLLIRHLGAAGAV